MQSPTNYRKKRYLVYLIATIVFLIFPFITINGNHIFLLSFDHKKLHLLGILFDIQEFYLMPFLLIMMFVGIFFMTTLAGRIWCGWACPQTIFRTIYRDLLQTKLFKLRTRIANKQEKLNLQGFANKLKAALAFIIIAFLCLVAAACLMFFFTPPEDFFPYILDPLNHKILLGFWLGFGIFFILDIAFIQENFCIYICPYCRVQSVLYDDDTIMVAYNFYRGGEVYDKKGAKNPLPPKKQDESNECTNCLSCVKVCPTHIDIRKGMQLECINCLECADACSNVMGKLGKKSLISWRSSASLKDEGKVRIIRFKTIGYVVVLAIALSVLLLVGSKKEGMLLNINRTAEAFIVREGNIVDNNYTMIFHNTQPDSHQFYFEIFSISDNDISDKLEILRPEKPFILKADQKDKKIVILRAKKGFDFKEGIYDIGIRAYALDAKDSIFVERKTKFIYPSQDKLK